MLSSKLVDANVIKFRDNDMRELEGILKNENYNRAIVCVEGIYSMDGDMVDGKVFDICDMDNVLLIVDEAHSSGVVGKNLLGVFDYYNIKPKSNHIKMGTLGKAYGSYGAYILADCEIISYLQNRAKAIIYTTAPSIFDIAFAYRAFEFIQKNNKTLLKQIEDIKSKVLEIFGVNMAGLILKLDMDSSKEVMQLKQKAKEKGFLIGAIRPPTVDKAIIRIIPRVGIDIDILKELRDEIYS
jgi:8-amino-7-oxononanoate synthase